MTSSPSGVGFQGRTVIITGASSGLGACLAEAFAFGGASPVLFARSEERLREVALRCKQAGANPLMVAGDVTLACDCEELVRQTIGRFGQLDILIACAGIGMWARFDELKDPAVLRRVMDVNYSGVVNPTLYALPYLRRSRGMLVAVSSIQGKIGVPYHSGYAASKHAIQGFCDSLRAELKGSGVGVMTVIAHWIRGTKLRENAFGKDGLPRGAQSLRHGSGAVPVEKMTEAILKGIRERKRAIFVPGWLRLLAGLSAISPSLADHLVARRVDREASRSTQEI